MLKESAIIHKIKAKHFYYKQSGFYKFLYKNILKLILFIAGVIFFIFIINYIFDFKGFIQNWLYKLNSFMVFSVFLFFQSVLGWIPPTDLFIAWTNQFKQPYIMVGILGLISYIGGINAYFIGKLIRKYPEIDNYLKKIYEKNMDLIEKWGGAVIIISAVFPLPYATTCTAAGMLKYPFKLFILFGLTRFIRFFLYAIPIFNAMDKIIS